MAVSTNLDSRYGRIPTRSGRDRRNLFILALALIVSFGAWLVWTGQDGSTPQIDASDVGHRIIDANTASVTFSVSMPAGTRSSCAVEALNETFTIVGWKVIDLPPSKRFTRTITQIVRTTELGNTGLIYRCWLT